MKATFKKMFTSYIDKVTASGIAQANVNANRFIQNENDQELKSLTAKWYFI